jgi:two-component sensor histidine kinase/PAS domain-containing protein
MPPSGSARFASLRPLARRLAGPASAVVFVGVAMAARILLGNLLPGLTVFSLYYPAILGAALIGGEASAALALVLGAASGWLILHNAQGLLVPMASVTLNVVIFLLAGAFVGAVGARLRRLLRRRRRDILRLADREARYRALFEGVSEGFAMIEGLRDDNGRITDFVLLEANPALIEMFKVTSAVVGRRRSEYAFGPTDPEYLKACERAFLGPPVRIELFSPSTQRWYDVRLSCVGEDRLAQILVDITDRKVAETRQVEMFNELNHRVKNNLAAVSAMLSMQARAADDARLRDQLNKAVDRIETIADVHASLYRVSSTDQVDFAAYLNRLCDRLAASLLDDDRVRIKVVADPAMAPLEEAVSLGLIVNELVTNAAKYAYPPPVEGVIQVTLRHAAGELVLKVSDEGRGLPAPDASSGIGMRLVRSLVQQCGGELQIDRERGASFTIRLRERDRPAPLAQRTLL